MKKNPYLIVGLLCLFVSACCKHKEEVICQSAVFEIQPFVQKFGYFQCQNNNEYTYAFRKKEQIDSLEPTCFLAAPVPFPIDETDMAYIIVGKMSYYYNDTFQTSLYRDTCAKKLTYNVNMIQRDTSLWSNGGGVLSIFCAVDSIPPDYEVEINYKYVPLPE